MNPHVEWLRSMTYILLVLGCYAKVAEDKIQTLPSIGGSRHRISIHRKKSERRRHTLSEEQLIPVEKEVTNADALDDQPSARRSLRDLKKKKDNKRHNRIKVRDNMKDDDKPDVKRGSNKDRSKEDKKKKYEGVEKIRKKKEKHFKAK